MPSPFDFALYLIAKFMKIEIFCCVHDLRAHPGESWPSESAIRSRIKLASALVAFSLPIASLLRTFSNKPIYVVPLPDTIPLIGNISSSAKSFLESMISSTKVKVLMIGRIHEYKNAPLILQVSSILNEFLFCIAGDLSIEIEETENILILNKWLTNLEFDSSLQAADIIVFPYSEASQSGSIPLAIAKNKWIVAADHPGFRDQLKLYDKKVLFQSNSSSEFSKALIQAKTLSQIEISRKEPSDKPEMRNRDLVGLLLQRMESN
jgi:glycosyltransferase involved in cell wall biosynthesis